MKRALSRFSRSPRHAFGTVELNAILARMSPVRRVPDSWAADVDYACRPPPAIAPPVSRRLFTTRGPKTGISVAGVAAPRCATRWHHRARDKFILLQGKPFVQHGCRMVARISVTGSHRDDVTKPLWSHFRAHGFGCGPLDFW